ncbi:MAG: hypothetical protein QM652_12340, partial [Legionella sp.]|uniref:hypothetical protein n=1 Tax=Legionella sp. TaxID=459 RepID=UPI0039E6334A
INHKSQIAINGARFLVFPIQTFASQRKFRSARPTTTLALSIGLFTKKMQPQRPSVDPDYSQDTKLKIIDESDVLSIVQEDIELPKFAK